MDFSFQAEMMKDIFVQSCLTIEHEYTRPSTMFKPGLSIDGNQWCALYGENLQVGVAGFGDSPALAFLDFDKNWNESLSSKGLPQ